MEYYSESAAVNELNEKIGLLNADPLKKGFLDGQGTSGSTYQTKYFLWDIHSPSSTENIINLYGKNSQIKIGLTQPNLLLVLDLLERKDTWISKYVSSLRSYIEHSQFSDWHNFIVDHKLNAEERFKTLVESHGGKMENFRSREERKKIILNGYEEIDRTRIDIINELILSGCLNQLISIFDIKNQKYAHQISYQGYGVQVAPLAGGGGVIFSYRGIKIARHTQWVS